MAIEELYPKQIDLECELQMLTLNNCNYDCECYDNGIWCKEDCWVYKKQQAIFEELNNLWK